MHIILNVGLAPSTCLKGRALRPYAINHLLATAGFTDIHCQLAISATEETAVIRCTAPDWTRDRHDLTTIVYSLAVILRQEAIAWCPVVASRVDLASGRLTGPHSTAWGDFDPNFFLS